MSPLPPRNPYIAGKALASERGFFGREDILREVERTLRRPDDNAIVLYGQRRIGKTSILLQLQHRLPSPPFVPIYFDLMDMARLPLSEVLYQLAVTTAAEVGAPPPTQTDFENHPHAFDQQFLPQLYPTLDELAQESQLVYLLDEFDVLDIDDPNLPQSFAAKAFFPYLRRLMTHQPRLNFVFVVGRRMEELSINFLSTFKAADARPISVLRPETATRLIRQAEQDGLVRYADGVVEHILSLTRGHPYFTQLTCQRLFDHAFDHTPQPPVTITLDDVTATIPAVLDAGKNAFQWIWDGLPPAERIIFSAIAGHSQADTIFSEEDLTTVLQEAGIRILVRELNLAPQTLVDWQMLEKVNGGYRVYVELLRRWVAEYRPLDRVKDELDRINPLADTLYQAAQGFYRHRDNTQAEAQLKQALDLNPNHLKARLLLGIILREEERLKEAISQFEELYRIDEREGRLKLVRTLLQYGSTLEQADAEDDALAVYDRVLELASGEQAAQARRAELWVQKGDRAFAKGDLEAAADAYEQAGSSQKIEQVREQQHKTMAREGEAYEVEQEWTRAVEIYQQLTKLDPDNERWTKALARVQEEVWLAERYAEGIGYIQQEEWDKAQHTLAEVIGKRSDYKDTIEQLYTAKQQREIANGEIVIKTPTEVPPSERISHRDKIRFVILFLVALLLLLCGLIIAQPSTTTRPQPTVTETIVAKRDTGSSVYSVAFSPDGTILATGSADNTVQLWQIADRVLLQTLEGHTGDVNSVAFSPDGKILASGSSDNTVRLWMGSDRTLLQTLEGHTGNVNSVAFSPSGKILASGSSDDTIKVWNMPDGALSQTSGTHIADVNSVAFSPDGLLLASGSSDDTVRLSLVTIHAPISTFKILRKNDVLDVAYSPDGTIALGSIGNQVELLREGSFSQTLDGHTHFVNSVVFSPDGQTLASGSNDSTVRLWRVSDGTLLHVLDKHTHSVTSVAFSPDGKTLASGSLDQTIRLWQIEN